MTRDSASIRSASTTRPTVNADAASEFMAAMAEYKSTSGRMFPTWSEVLEVVRSLGYVKGGYEAQVA